MDFKGKGILEERSSSQVNNYEANMLQGATDSPVDLTLRLGISPASDEQSRPGDDTIHQTFPQRPFPHAATGSTSMGNFPQADINPLAAYQINSASRSSFNVHYAAAAHQKKYEFPAPPQLNKYCLINISTKKAKTGGSRKRTATARPPARGDDEKRTCTNYYCRITKAPMWRRGPLGAKTLCNRCGIRYRKLKIKQQEKEKEAEEAAARKGSRAAANAN